MGSTWVQDVGRKGNKVLGKNRYKFKIVTLFKETNLQLLKKAERKGKKDINRREKEK